MIAKLTKTSNTPIINLLESLNPKTSQPTKPIQNNSPIYTYNYNNQLTQYTQDSLTLTFQYDALGNRIRKTQGTTTTKYIIDPNRGLPSVLAETNASGTITAYYVYGLGLISKIEGNNAYFYQYDGLGSTIAITDKNGNIKNKYAYDDFGNIATNSTETIPNPFKYVGRYGVMTDLPDLLYMRARYYVPSIGRFISKDPIGFASGLNLYEYVGGNPINKIDPLGLQSVPIGFWDSLDSFFIPPFFLSTPNIERDPISGLKPFNPGRDANGKCNPCPPPVIWEASGNKHGSKCGKHYHGIIWNQDPKTCMCYPRRVSGSNPNQLE